MNYVNIKHCDIANGTGPRVSLFVSGCESRCEGCFNKDAWPFEAGEEVTDEVISEIVESLAPPYIDGLSILGGEPLHPRNLDGVRSVIEAVRRRYRSKDVWMWTGYVLEALSDAQREVAGMADVVVDGPYVMDKRDIMLRFRGSSNQRVIDMRRTKERGEVVLWEDVPAFSTHGWVGHD